MSETLTSDGVWYAFTHGLEVTFADYRALWRTAFLGDFLACWLARYTILSLHCILIGAFICGLMVGFTMAGWPL